MKVHRSVYGHIEKPFRNDSEACGRYYPEGQECHLKNGELASAFWQHKIVPRIKNNILNQKPV